MVYLWGGNIDGNEGRGTILCRSLPSNQFVVINGYDITLYGDNISKKLAITYNDIKLNDKSIIDDAITTEDLNEVLV